MEFVGSLADESHKMIVTVVVIVKSESGRGVDHEMRVGSMGAMKAVSIIKKCRQQWDCIGTGYCP